MSINDFIARVQQYGLLKPSRYEIQITGPGFVLATQKLVDIVPIVGSVTGLNLFYYNELFRDSCENISFPGSTIASKDFTIYGPPREVAYERLYSGDLDITFRLDAKGILRRLFMAWQESIVNPETNDVEYYDNYISEIKINVLNELDEITFSGTATEAYPKVVSPLDLGFEQQNTYLKQTVSFAYRKFIQE